MVGWVGLSQSVGKLGLSGSMKMEPLTTLAGIRPVKHVSFIAIHKDSLAEDVEMKSEEIGRARLTWRRPSCDRCIVRPMRNVEAKLYRQDEFHSLFRMFQSSTLEM